MGTQIGYIRNSGYLANQVREATSEALQTRRLGRSVPIRPAFRLQAMALPVPYQPRRGSAGARFFPRSHQGSSRMAATRSRRGAQPASPTAARRDASAGFCEHQRLRSKELLFRLVSWIVDSDIDPFDVLIALDKKFLLEAGRKSVRNHAPPHGPLQSGNAQVTLA